jgi:hypothetical protein
LSGGTAVVKVAADPCLCCLLQEELKMMQNLNPAELVALEKEVGGLVAQVAAAEARKAALEMQVRAAAPRCLIAAS